MITPSLIASQRDVARHYDDLDTFYLEVWGEHLHHGYWADGRESVDEAVTALVDLAASNARIAERDRVCDVGCGYGAAAAHLASRHGASVTGVTLSKTQHQYAVVHHAAPNCRFINADWLENDFPASSFDVLTAIECLSHMTDKTRFFDEALRVLVPSGRLAICAWLAGDPVSERQTRWLLEPICREGRLPSLPNLSDVVELATNAGFEILSADLITRQVRRTWNICLRRLAGRFATERRYWRYLFDSGSSDRDFLRSVARIMIAYRTGAMEYGLIVGRKPVET